MPFDIPIYFKICDKQYGENLIINTTIKKATNWWPFNGIIKFYRKVKNSEVILSFLDELLYWVFRKNCFNTGS